MKDYDRRLKVCEKEVELDSDKKPFPLWIYTDGVLDRGDGSEKEEVTPEELDKLQGKGRNRQFVIIVNHPVLA